MDSLAHPALPSPATSRVDVVTGFLDALARAELDDALAFVAPTVDWTYRDRQGPVTAAATGSAALRALLRENPTVRETTIVCVDTHTRYVIVSEHVRDADGRTRERHGAYVVEGDLVTRAWVSDL